MSEASSGGTKCWECIHCHKQLPGSIPGSLPFCPFCAKPQSKAPEDEVNCVNPECGTKLFSSTAKLCHKCHTPQQQKPHEDPPVEQTQTQRAQQHKVAVKEALEARKSKEEMTRQSESPQTRTHEDESKQDAADKNSLASSKTQLLPENGQPDLQENKKLESTNVTSASLSSEISIAETTSVSQDKVNDNQTPLQVSDSTTKTGDIQQESNYLSSQPQGPLEGSQPVGPLKESQPVEKTQIQDTKSAGDTPAPQPDSDKSAETVEAQKSEGEMTHQAEHPQSSSHETESKQDAADKNSLASKLLPDLQENADSNSQAKKLESTNATSAKTGDDAAVQKVNSHPSSQQQSQLGEGQPVEKTEVQDTKSAGNSLASKLLPDLQENADSNSQAKKLESTNATSAKTGDDAAVQKVNSHPSSQQQSQLGEGQPVEKTEVQDTKSAGDTQAPQPDSDKSADSIQTRSLSSATGIKTPTSSNSSATPLQNANLRQGPAHESKQNSRKRGLNQEEEPPDPKQPKIFGQNPTNGSGGSSVSPDTTSTTTTPIQETTPGGDSSAGELHKKPGYKEQPVLFVGVENSRGSGRPSRDANKMSGQTQEKKSGRGATEVDTTGIRVSPDKAVTVRFHVLVPQAVWNWDQKSRICLHFGHKKLGNWECDIGEFDEVRDTGEGLFEMCCILPIDTNILQKEACIPYKYVIHSKRKEAILDPHEWLHGATTRGSKVTNRCLRVPKRKAQNGGQYDQYDSMVYPETKSKSVIQRITGWIPFLKADKEEQLVIPHHESMQNKCLQIYLEMHQKILCTCELTTKFNIISIAEDIVGIFKQLFLQLIYHEQADAWKADSLPEAMKEWLYSVVLALNAKQCATQEENGKRIAAVSSVIYCFDMLSPRPLLIEGIHFDCIADMMSMLTLRPDTENRKCIDYEYIDSLIPQNSKKKAAEAINRFCVQLLHNRKLQSPQWLYAVPLIHFLRGDCKPFQVPELNPEKMMWGDKNLGLSAVRSQTHDKAIKFVAAHFEPTRPLIAADPLFLQVFIYICPKVELQHLVPLISPCVSTSWISQTITDSPHLNQKEITDITKLVRSVTDVVNKIPEQNQSTQELDFTVRAAVLLFSRLTRRLQSDAAFYTDALKAALILIFNSLRNFSSGNAENCEVVTAKVKDTSNRLYQYLKEYIGASNMMGRGPFGGYRTQQAEKELKLWNSLLHLECPDELVGDWHCVVKRIVTERVAGINAPSVKVDLFCLLLDSCEKTHPQLADIFMEATSQSLQKMGNKEAVSSIEKLHMSKGDRIRRGQLYGKLLQMQYPNGAEFMTFEELLKWELWPSFIKIYASEPHDDSSLPEHCQLMCACACSKVEEICDQICSGNITIKQLEKINANIKQMERLCTEASSSAQTKFSFQEIKNTLDQRINEYTSFCKTKTHLHYLCSQVTINIQGLPQLINQLEANYDERNINTLCSSDSEGRLTFRCFESAGKLHSIAAEFDCMAHDYGNDLFNKIWQYQVKAAERQNAQLQIDDIVTLMWDPTFRKCKTLLDSLHSRTIKLYEVDEFFQRYQSNSQSQQLKALLTSLAKGVNACLCRSHETLTWISGVVYTMQEYWTLCKHATAAATFLELQKKLQLSGNFHSVERLAAKASTSMRDQTLDDVDHSLVETGKFLHEFVSDSEKLDCLQIFAKCLNMINWIRKETKDVGDLQKFVNIALATAAGGEDALTCDKLSNLVKVGSGFGSLIYNLKQDASFKTLADSCRSVWEAMKHTPSLPKLLCDCTKELDWYKAVKETQGSVERTTFGQMNNVIAYGCYKIGSRKLQIFQSREEIIHITLDERDKRLHKKSYTLEDLKDLESKLVLITGSKAENRTEVDYFLDILHSVCRIADVLLALQQAGNVKYTGWVLSVPCQYAKDGVDKLQAQAKKMEIELQKWENEVKHNREEFYELNYYTTLQLLSLRSELGKLKQSLVHGVSEICPTVLTLLHSISPEIATSDFKVVQDVTAVLVHSREDPMAHIPHPLVASTVDTASVHKMEPESKSSVAADIFASIDTQDVATLPDVPQAKLTERDLNDRQKEIYANLVDYAGYPQQLVLMAIEKHKEDEYDIRDWCLMNSNTFRFSEEELEEDQERSDDEDVTSEESESEDAASHFSATAAVETPVIKEVPISEQTSTEIIVKIKQRIDESHPDVQHLILEGGFDTDESIEAIERCGSVSEAMDYLMSGEQGGLFQPTLPSPGEIMQETRKEQMPSRGYTEQSREEGITIYCDDTAETKYLSLLELGVVLNGLSSKLPAAVSSKRTFPKLLKTGQPNLVMTSPETILRTALSLYMEDEDLPLPTYEEVLVCHPNTTAEEVTLLWQRAIGDPDFKRIFCLVHAEKLSYQVCDKILRALTEFSPERADYRLVMICSNEENEKSHIISKLQLFHRQYTASTHTPKFQHYLRSHFKMETEMQQYGDVMAASVVDCENLCVRVVRSTRSGMGKSLFITRMADQLKSQRLRDTPKCVAIPIHGPVISSDIVLEFLNPYTSSHCTIFHFDIAPRVLREVDCILFYLLILRGLSDSKGRIWRCHPSQLYAIEVTLPEIQDTPQGGTQTLPESRTLALLELLPSVNCVSPKKALQLMETGEEDPSVIVMDQREFESAIFQRVYQYLRRYYMGMNLDTFSYGQTVEGTPANCLEIIMHYCGISDPSWSEVHHFIRFLDLQLGSCEESVFCDEQFVGDVMAGLKSFVVKFMIRMSRDFATSSLCGEVARENEELDSDSEDLDSDSEDLDSNSEDLDSDEEEDLRQYEIDQRKRWEQSSHPYIFFNQDRMSITFVGFMVTPNGDLIDRTAGGIQSLERAIMTKQLYTGLKQNRVNFDENYQNWETAVMIEKIGTVMGLDYIYNPDSSYVLTVDNLIKILAIQMRFRCGIPVVIMGETGCGKTRLIRYMCDLAKQGILDRKNMLIMKIHGGIRKKDVINFIKQAEDQAVKNREHNLDTVVFFDEANTTEAIGLIKEVMCDRRFNGSPISPDLKFIAACNPYRKHTEDMIKKLESAGLGFYVRDTQQKLGQIPLRQLVYRVLELPPSMRPLVYDFGQLNTKTESAYTRQIVLGHVKKNDGIPKDYIKPIANVLAFSQQYMRERQDECSFVSLRDVERAMIVLEYFLDKMAVFMPPMDQKAALAAWDDEEDPPGPNNVSRSLVLALSVCYHARLQDREDYEEGVAYQFTPPLNLPGGAQQFRNEIRWCQEVLLDNMTLGPNIARNAALRENIFMMTVCIELRIPLFLVGKPGSSKSLAKSIVASCMQGQASKSDLLKGFKQVHMFSYQCSQLSTPESVIEVFNTAKGFQKDRDTNKYVSVVVLDEVGLAEDSPNLPLKALHPLLEDGTEGADDSQQVIDREKRVAFIGISNWALDPAKMNRGVMVTRGNPDIHELELSARGICSDMENDIVKKRLEGHFQPLAAAYEAICLKQKKEFFGLRDFYSLIKMLYWLCEKSGIPGPPTWSQLEHAIRRNFGGLDDQDFDPLEEFRRRIPHREDPDLTQIPPELHSVVKPDSSPLGLIKTSLRTKETSWHGENRYLLFLTENYAALEILHHYLHDMEGPTTTPTDASWEEEGRIKEMDPFILFGSSFPKDKEYTQVCRNINQIKICMETGRTVILLNLENLYESLYDVLNQYYIYHGESRYVDLGLQTHRVKCRVHDNFKLIMIAEKSTVYEKFPTPLINRLEKHFVLTSSALTNWQLEVLEQLQEWAHQFSCVSGFKERHAFIGYQKDTPAAVVFQATNQLQSLKKRGEDPNRFRKWKQASILGNLQPDTLMEEEETSDECQVFQLSQYLLLQTASPDAFFRLKNTPLADQQAELWELYNEVQHHTSLEEFLLYHLIQSRSCSLLLQVTTHSHLLSGEEVEDLGKHLGYGGHIAWFLLQEFDTELNFSNKVSPAFKREPNDSQDFLLIIQCDSGHLDGDLIACARYRIYDERAKSSIQNSFPGEEGSTHVLFVIHLPQQVIGSSFVGFQGDPWISTHIDDLRCINNDTDTLNRAMTMPLSSLFIIPDAEQEEQMPMETESLLVNEELQADATQHNTRVEDEDSRKTELSAHHGLDIEHPVYLETSPVESSMEQTPLSTDQFETSNPADQFIPPPKYSVPSSERTMNHIMTDLEESMEQLNVEKASDKMPEQLYVSEDNTEATEPMMDSATAQQEIFNEDSTCQPQPTALKKSGYFDQLHSCIQAAASRLQDSTKNKERATERVKLLVDLIPRSPDVLDGANFHGVLVIHIHQLLEERDRVREDEKDWVLREALSAKKLQSGGTFRNVIARKLDEVIIPIFAEIIALIDRNYNLDLASPKSNSTPLTQFWLAMFRDPKVMHFSYTEMSVREQIPGIGGRMAEEEFRCQLPFSWLVQEAFEAQWDSAKSTSGNRFELYTQLYTLVLETPIGGVLESVNEISCKLFYQYYLHDYVRSVHKCNHKKPEYANIEYMLIEKALSGLIHSSEDFSSSDGHESLTRRIAAIHVVYHAHRSHLLWFGQLVSHMPGILVTLEQRMPTDSEEMLLHLYAVERALEMLNPLAPLKKDTLESVQVLQGWLNQLKLSQIAINSILNLPSEYETARKARLHWQLIRMLQMFVEHIVLKYEGMEKYARRLEMYLKSDPDFLKASTIDKVKKLLNSMDSELEKRKFKGKPKKLASIRRSCRAFFMELISTLCFGGREPPEEELIQMLVNTVFTERQEIESVGMETREFNYREDVRDKIPVIRSFLLQLLLEHNTELVKAHLADYFRKSQQAMSTAETADRDLYLLCVQCFEDALYKRCVAQSFLERLTSATNFLIEGHDTLTSFGQRDAPLDFLEGIAKVRYGLSVVAELLNKQISRVGTAIQLVASDHCHGAVATQLLQVARMLCTDKGINHIDATGGSDTTGPIAYLLKLLMRQYGSDCLQKVSEAQHWVMPPELRQGEEEKTRDLFILYGQSYSALRMDMTEAIIGEQFEQFSEVLQELSPQETPLLLLALYQKVTLSRASTLPSKLLLPDLLDELGKPIAESKVLSRELQWMGRELIANEQGGPLAQLKVTPGQPSLHQTLGAIVVHAAAILQWRQRVDILKPFTNMLNNPVALVNAYLPTMPEDSLAEVRGAIGALGGTFYECPRGHPYLVTECGKPQQQYICNVCGSQIGHGDILGQLLHDNRNARQNDLTQTGHCLGQPEGRSTIPAPERTLSPAACCIFRALMHSALLWTSCNDQTATEGLFELVKPHTAPAQLPEFFWHHLERDLQLLGRATGKSVDEAAIILHLVLRGILLQEPPQSDAVSTVSTLADRNARQEWEKIFNLTYIQPILENVEENVTEALDCVVKDDDQEQDQLFYLVYERVRVAEGSLTPHLWTYRSRVTLEHLSQTLQQQRKKNKCPILHYFLQDEHLLRATQYLPDIVRLQQRLYDSFHHRLDRREAKHITIGEFFREMKSEKIRNEYQGMVESLQKAWQLVGDQLRDHARLRIDEAHLLPAITENTPLEYLIPTTTGAGACTTALVDFLVLVHNDFIERCRGIVTEQETSKPSVTWRSKPVPLPYIHDCHLLIYEHQLPSIILSHCQYSLEVGKGQDVSYDWPALEKDILGRFIHGKPLIQSNIPQVVYRKDIYTAATFAAVRKKVEPQIQLHSRVQQEIIQELRSVDRIREALDVVDIVIGFLSSGGGKADQQLKEYITRALRMKKRSFSKKAQEHCTLGHILSLWETLSVELARQLVLSRQDPFDSVRAEFSKELISEGEESQTTALDRCFRSFNLDHLLGILYEFNETHVKHCPDNESDWSLVHTLDPFLERNNLPRIPRFAEEFPKSITLAQTVAVWKYTIQYQDRQKREG